MTTTDTSPVAAAIEADLSVNLSLARSVVKGSYKRAYAERAIVARGKKGVDKRVVADSCGDWLALELAALVRPAKKSTLDMAFFQAILDANGVDYSRLPVGTPNWQGRFRMNGGQMLRTRVAEAGGVFVIPAFAGLHTQTEETTLQAPAAWVARNGG